MAKANYTKVEEAFAEGLLKMEVSKLLDIADQAAQNAPAGEEKDTPKPTSAQRQLLIVLKYEFRHLKKQGHDPHKKFNLDRKQFKKFLDDPGEITIQEWEKLKTITQQIVAFKAELEKAQPQVTPEEVVEQERRKQKNKRFNVNDKWLPLR